MVVTGGTLGAAGSGIGAGATVVGGAVAGAGVAVVVVAAGADVVPVGCVAGAAAPDEPEGAWVGGGVASTTVRPAGITWKTRSGSGGGGLDTTTIR